MGAILAVGMSFLLFIVVSGIMWLFGTYAISQVILNIPLTEDPDWSQAQMRNNQITLLLIQWVPGLMALFAGLKLLTGSTAIGGR